MQTPFRALLLGAPGAGKGTQAARLTSKLGFTVLSSGDLLRQAISAGTEDGLAAQSYVRGGQLVPDALVGRLVLAQTEKSLLSKGKEISRWALDGFPRSISQAESLESFLATKKAPLDAVFNLDVPHSVLVQRIEDRWVHAPSGRTYNLSFNPPKTPGKDDVTGEPLSKREDDNVEVYKERLKTYRKLTELLIEYYTAKGILVNFKGETSDEIWPQILSYVQSRT